MVKVEVHEVEGMQLLARTGSGFAFVMDSPKDNGGLERNATSCVSRLHRYGRDFHFKENARTFRKTSSKCGRRKQNTQNT